MKLLRTHHSTIQRQRGVVFIVMMVIMVLGTATFLVSSLNSASLQIARDQVTADALAQAKEALLGYAASAQIDPNTCLAPGNNCKRPGDLPCPDTDNDGIAGSTIPLITTCNSQSQRIGRLPWKTLGLPDLRDGSGERLWYAVSNNFKNNTRTICTTLVQTGCLNSDTVGTITIRSSDSNVIYDASLGNGVAAVVIAPGEVLQRTDKPSPQDRSNTGINTITPENYLDTALGEDNANFIDTLTNGFIQGRIKDGNGNVILNDQLLVITQNNIMQPVQKRVAAEVKQCLNEYASPLNSGYGRYPWAAKLDPTSAVNYNDTTNRLFGRVPDTPFDNTKNSGDNLMNDQWTGNCNINSGSGWWLNWKEIVFYGLASAFRPIDPPNTPASCGTCLGVNPPSATSDKKFVVIVAGKTLPAQARANNSDKGTLSNYLEGNNANGATLFEQSPLSTTFNDTVVFQ